MKSPLSLLFSSINGSCLTLFMSQMLLYCFNDSPIGADIGFLFTTDVADPIKLILFFSAGIF